MIRMALKCCLIQPFKVLAPFGALSLMAIVYRGERFEDYNVPKRTPNHPSSSHAVLAKKGDVIKLLRFGAKGAKTYPPKAGESARDKAMRRAWYARHAGTLKGAGVLDKIYWAAKVKW